MIRRKQAKLFLLNRCHKAKYQYANFVLKALKFCLSKEVAQRRLCANEPRTTKDAAAFRSNHYHTRDGPHTDTSALCKVRQCATNAKVHKTLHHAAVSTAIVEFLARCNARLFWKFQCLPKRVVFVRELLADDDAANRPHTVSLRRIHNQCDAPFAHCLTKGYSQYVPFPNWAKYKGKGIETQSKCFYYEI